MAGRIETYLHSDKSVPNKGGSIVRVLSQTDFAARTDEFISFTKDVAKMAFAFGAADWDALVQNYPDIETQRQEVSAAIGEKVAVDQIVIVTL